MRAAAPRRLTLLTMPQNPSSLLNPPRPAPDGAVSWPALPDSLQALALVEAACAAEGPVLAIARGEHAAYALEAACRYFAPDTLPIMHFPDLEVLPYDALSPLAEIISERLAALTQLPNLQHGLVIAGADVLLQRLPPTDYIQGQSFDIRQGAELDPLVLRSQLEAAGYSSVPEVDSHGQFALRGSLLDLYPMGSAQAYRIDWFDKEVDSIRSFDPETQRSADKLDRIHTLPAHEFPLDSEGIEGFRRRYRQAFTGDLTHQRIYQGVSQGQVPSGIESFLPLFFDATAHLADYLPQTTTVVRVGGTAAALEDSWRTISARHENLGVDPDRPLLAPDIAFWKPEDGLARIQAFAGIVVDPSQGTPSHDIAHGTLPAAPPPGDRDAARAYVQSLIAAHPDQRVLIVAPSAGRQEDILELLRPLGLSPRSYPSWQRFVGDSKQLGVAVGPLQSGFALDNPKLAVLSESMLLGTKPPTQRRRKPARDPESILRDLTDLKPGAPVVHQQHGVGRYQGLEKLTVGGHEQEFLLITYAKDDKLYVPVSQLGVIHRYTGAEPQAAPIHALGTERWSKARKKAAERARDVAAELLEIQAKRAAKPGHAHPMDAADYAKFAASFPYTETQDQLTAISAVIDDLCAPRPMDRVVCGDVGFGKTEVAMRAAFVAANGGRQVCLLVPTTLLASQHTQNFLDRFADWPIKVESLSRLKSKKEQDALLARLKTGETDIVIGTHRLLQSDVKFNNLGLVIVDEEHRFGVRHKERLKAMRAEVDLLTLTATPIPRTLNMSLSGLRDLSIIATAPTARTPIKTFVAEWDRTLVREACLREIRRGGQVYVLHNEVSSIARRAEELAEWIPEASVRYAHGQMREREMETVMLDFYHQRFNLLVSTTIIESGIDVPTANTIVIERADKLGLAQLHQLRGRVGRSHHRAYAYMLTPDKRSLKADAIKRLEAIESLGELGAGFTLATHDLEIRGAGELLGEDQTGQIEEVGFAMYSTLLDRAVAAARDGKLGDLDMAMDSGAEVDLGLPALLPEDYIPDVNVRLTLYKRLSTVTDEAGLREMKVEMIDRFGLLPPATETLCAVTALRMRCDAMGVAKLLGAAEVGRFEFTDKPDIEPMNIIRLIQRHPKTHKFDGKRKLSVGWDAESADARIDAAHAVLDALAGKVAEAS